MDLRTFANPDSFELLSKPSLHFPMNMEKAGKVELLKLKYLAAYRRMVYMTDVQCSDFFTFFVVHRRPLPGRWMHVSYSSEA
jgi:hypothetical protein